MEKIRQLFEETKGLEGLARMYRDGKREILQLESEIEMLREERSGLNISGLDKQIEGCVGELNIIAKEIDCNKIIENKCISLDELGKALDVIMDESLCLEKCLGFMDNLIATFSISNAQAEEHLKLRREEECFKLIKISNEAEELFRMSKSRPFFRRLESDFKSRVKEELEGAVPFDVEVFSASGTLYVVFPSEGSPESDEVRMQGLCRETFSSLVEPFNTTVGCILFILKANLAHSFIRDNYSMVDLAENNKKLEGTEFHIENVEEWALDCVMKDVASIPRTKVDVDDICPVDDGVSGAFVSNSYSRLMRLSKFIESSNSARKEKARAFYDKTVLKFFDLGRVREAGDAFVMYSDVSHFIKKHAGSRCSEDLGRAREELFHKIMDLSTSLDIDLSQSVLTLKARIKQRQFDFYESVGKFVHEKARKFFKIQFFERLYGNFLGTVIRPQKLSTSDKNVLKELAQYLLDISFEIGSEAIANYCKIAALCECLDSSLEELIELYEFGGISLGSSELRMVVRIMFEESELRESFINRLL